MGGMRDVEFLESVDDIKSPAWYVVVLVLISLVSLPILMIATRDPVLVLFVALALGFATKAASRLKQTIRPWTYKATRWRVLAVLGIAAYSLMFGAMVYAILTRVLK